MSDIFFKASDSESVPDEIKPSQPNQSIADQFHEQVEAFYSLPRPNYDRKEIVFSPSGVGKCARELFYINTNAPQDVQPSIPWRERMARNGTGSHEATQHDYYKMENRLKEAGENVYFRFLEDEIKGERTFQVGKYTVKIRGRSDGKIGLLDENGEVIDIIGWEKKTKDKRKNLNKLMKEGQPQAEHRLQAVAYALIFGISKWIFEYESLQKPEWSDINPEKEDIAHYYVEISTEEAKNLLIHLAKVVKAIEENQLPPAELDKCGFCPFKEQCAKDGGYDPENPYKPFPSRKKKKSEDD